MTDLLRSKKHQLVGNDSGKEVMRGVVLLCSFTCVGYIDLVVITLFNGSISDRKFLCVTLTLRWWRERLEMRSRRLKLHGHHTGSLKDLAVYPAAISLILQLDKIAINSFTLKLRAWRPGWRQRVLL
jgi:hypothetical protein